MVCRGLWLSVDSGGTLVWGAWWRRQETHRPMVFRNAWPRAHRDRDHDSSARSPDWHGAHGATSSPKAKVQ